MGFVLENISDADRKLYQTTLPNRELPITKWVIDREEDAYLIFKTRDYQSNYKIYEMVWRGHILKIFLEEINPREDRTDNNVKIDVRRTLREVEIPTSLHDRIDFIKTMIEEALRVYGWNGSSENTGKVDIQNINSMKIHYIDNLTARIN